MKRCDESLMMSTENAVLRGTSFDRMGGALLPAERLSKRMISTIIVFAD